MTLHRDDETDLGRFFAESGRAQRSIQGPILEKMMLRSVRRKKSKEPITARPTAETRTVYAVEPDVSDHALFGRVSRKLQMVTRRHYAVLAVFYGDEGARCAEHQGLARIVALYMLTKPGQKLAEQERKSGAADLSTLELIQNAVTRSKKTGAPAPLLDMVTQAHARAVELQERAEAAYTKAGDEVDAGRPKAERPRWLRVVGDGE